MAKCTVCHGFEQTTPSSKAPTLRNVFGREIAGDTFLHYSKGLSSMKGVWDGQRLGQFLKDPASFSPGTLMPKIDLTSDELSEIVQILKEYSN